MQPLRMRNRSELADMRLICDKSENAKAANQVIMSITVVLTAVARLEFMEETPTLANIAVRAAKNADRSA